MACRQIEVVAGAARRWLDRLSKIRPGGWSWFHVADRFSRIPAHGGECASLALGVQPGDVSSRIYPSILYHIISYHNISIVIFRKIDISFLQPLVATYTFTNLTYVPLCFK